MRSVEIHRAFSDNPAIKEFRNNSDTYKKYEKAAERLREKGLDYSDEINRQLAKKYGAKFIDLDDKAKASYMNDGIQMMQKWASGDEHNKLLKDVVDSSKAYESDVNKFINKYRNSVMERTTNDIAVKYDPKTGSAERKTVNVGDVMAIEMLRDKNGRIYN